MANYYLDTEFLEGTQKEKFPISLFRKETKPTIDLISIGICSSDDREYYAISKDFNLREAWNRYDLKINKHYPMGGEYVKEYWIRHNVLRPIFDKLLLKYYEVSHIENAFDNNKSFNYSTLKMLINKYGETNKEIAREIKRFIYEKEDVLYNHVDCKLKNVEEVKSKINLYTYYGAYDHVVFCWLFGNMIDLPKGFPMYCRDLKQMLDKKADEEITKQCYNSGNHTILTLDEAINLIKQSYNYPEQTNEHNALADARWNKKLHEFLKSI